ncbi:MAG TPA: tetratricopeptide repeat protein [Longimicrobiales bacterium]
MTPVGRFLGELRRRRVVRVGIGYAVVGWITLQVAGEVVPALGLAESAVTLVLVLILLGFPLALVLAWAYDLTPDGVRRAASPERWRQVPELLEQALALDTAQRNEFVQRATRHDAALRAELESLLAAHVRAGPLDRPLADWIEPPRSEDVAGRTIGHYVVLEKLGGGGMGVVYRARDQLLDRFVALKFLPPHLGLRTDAKQRFLIEAQAAAALDHPNICTVHEVGETPAGQLFIAMPYYDGETLAQRIARGRLPVGEAVDLAIQAARGLAKAHDRGIVHRDIKPANLILTADGVLKIVDFGIAKLADVTGPSHTHGTIAYMSPEHARGDAVTHRTDLWSLGVVLYEMLSGERPFRGGTDAIVLQSIAAAVVPPLPVEHAAESIGRIIERMLAADPEARYASATDLIRDLERFRAERARVLHDDATAAADADATGPTTTLARDGERRPATVVVANLSGYAGLVERLVPERLAWLSEQVRAAAAEIAARQGGVLDEFRDDELILLFGVSNSHEDHCLRAVRAALELHERVRSLREEKDGRNPDVRLHTGVASGLLVAQRTEGANGRYRVTGAAMHIARRLAAHAAADEVWIPPECHRVVGPFFDTEPRPALELRDRPNGIVPRRVIRHTGVRSRLDAALRSGLTHYVGRDAELGRLEQELAAAVGGAGHVVAITGEPGMGKSRLLYELRQRHARAGVQLLQGRCQSHGTTTSYLPFVEVLRTCFALNDDSSPQAAAAAVAQRVHEIAAELDEFVPLYLHLLSIESREHPVPRHLHGDQLRVAIQEAIAALLTLSARARPVLLLLEDWHWADDASQAVLEQIMDIAAESAFLGIVTSRQPIEWRGQLQHTALTLEPLGPDATAAMLRSIAGVDEFPDGVAAVLHARTGGNPFFLEEICHALLEEGTLRVSDRGVVLTGPLDALQLPDTVQAVIRTRLDRLERETRDTIRLASVVGREFSRSLLERALPHAGRLPNALQGLKAAGLIQQVRVVPDAVFRFKHALTQEVAYGSLLEHQRRELHGRVASAIETLYDGRLRDHWQQLAYHHSGAEHWPQAVEYGTRAADRLTALSEFSEALTLLERCEDWLDRIEPEPAAGVRIEILLRQERLCETLGLRGRQQLLIDRLIALLEHSGDDAHLAEVLLRQGDLCTLLHEWDRAERALEASLRIRRALGDPVGERNTLRSLGLMQWHQGRHDDALRSIEATLALDRERGDIAAIVGDLSNKGAVLKACGDLDRARAVLEEALALSERAAGGDPNLPSGIKLHYILHNLANVCRAQGDIDGALTHLQRSVSLTHQKHLPIQVSYHYTSIAHIALQQGRVEESIRIYRQAVDAGRRANYSPGLSQALSMLGEVLVGLGRHEDALSCLHEAAALFAQLKDPAAEARMRALEGTAHEAIGRTLRQAGADPDTVRAHFDAALALAAARSDAAAEARIRNSLGILAWEHGEFERALSEYERALAGYRSLADENAVGLILNSIAVTLLKLGRYDDADRVLDEALGSHRAAGSVLLEAHALTACGELCEARAQTDRAIEHYEESRVLRERAGDRAGAGWMLHRTALLAARTGAAAQARELVARASGVAAEVDDAELRAACAQLVGSVLNDRRQHAPLHHRA